MDKATLFKNGGSQAVRLPKSFRFEGTEVFIRRVPEGVLLISKEKHAKSLWEEWANQLNQYDEPLEIERGGEPQEREGLDELFS